jgi:hypothetical protein
MVLLISKKIDPVFGGSEVWFTSKLAQGSTRIEVLETFCRFRIA